LGAAVWQAAEGAGLERGGRRAILRHGLTGALLVSALFLLNGFEILHY
jgi:hypothetical protein